MAAVKPQKEVNIYNEWVISNSRILSFPKILKIPIQTKKG